MDQDKAILIVNAIVNKENMADVKHYMENIPAVFSKNGARPVASYKTVEQIVGDESPEMVAIFEFDNADAIKNLINGVDFKALAETRAKAFSKLNLMICASN